MNKRRIDRSEPSLGRVLKELAANKLVLVLSGLTVITLAGVLIFSSAIAAQSNSISVAGGETLEAICQGRGFQMQRLSRTILTLVCVPTRDAGDAPEPPPHPTETSPPQQPTATMPPSEPTQAPPPQLTATPLPSPTEPPLGPAAPYPGAPQCPDHNDTAYHGLWDAERGCHYDHTHGVNPYQTIFAEVAAGWEQGISYPWQTPNENHHKHKGYVYVYTEAAGGCELFNLDGNPNCVTHVLYQLHSAGTNMEMTTRLHSFRIVARVCDPSLSQCGFVQTGGWSDYGVLHCPYKQAHCPLASDPQPLPGENGLPELVTIQQTPYRAVVPIDLLDRSLQSGKLVQFWNSLGPNAILSSYYPNPYNQLFGSAWQALDAWGPMDPNNPGQNLFICEDGSCTFNHSALQVFSIRLQNLPAGPFNGFTDLRGNINPACTQTGPECVPLIIEAGVPAGTAWLNRSVDIGSTPILEFDIYFDGQGNVVANQLPQAASSGWIQPQK